jgi:hypothetical protein
MTSTKGKHKTSRTKKTSHNRSRKASSSQVKKKTSKHVSVTSLVGRIKQSQKRYLARRPHRSFKLTRRRDYQRSLDLPGYFAFTLSVVRHLLTYKKLFVSLIVIMTVLGIVFVGMSSQDKFVSLSTLLSDYSKEAAEGGYKELTKTLALAFGTTMSSLSVQPSEVEQLISIVFSITIWLTTVWLIRAQLSGRDPKLRDGLYNAGSPIISTFLVVMILLLQLAPAFIGYTIYNIAANTNALANGIVAFLASVILILMIILSIYLITSTVIALIVVALPGMYPWRAIAIAGDLVTGRRLRVLLRITWMIFILAVSWLAIILPILLFTSWMQTTYEFTSWIPIAPIVLSLASTTGIVFGSSYIYLLYRGIVNDDSPPA